MKGDAGRRWLTPRLQETDDMLDKPVVKRREGVAFTKKQLLGSTDINP